VKENSGKGNHGFRGSGVPPVKYADKTTVQCCGHSRFQWCCTAVGCDRSSS